MAQILISDQSRYIFRPVIRESSKVVRIQPFRGLIRTDFSDNVTIALKKSDRLDLLSFQLYGTSRFDWIIASFNDIKFPIADLQELDTIIAPSKETLFDSILPTLELELESL